MKKLLILSLLSLIFQLATFNSIAQCAATYTDTINLLLHDGINCIDYPIVKIGNQWWMGKNVNATLYADGAPVAGYNYNNDTAYGTVYGKLYEWSSAMNGAASSNSVPSGIQGVCPAGWHLPSDAEWKQLEMNLGMSQAVANSDGWRGTDEGGKLKETGNTHWASPNTGATNSSGFSALPGGSRSTGGTFLNVGGYGYWWSATESGTYAWYRFLDYTEARVYRNSTIKAYGFSCRCVKDIDLFANLTISVSNPQSAISIYPNLSNSDFIIEYSLVKDGKATLRVFNVFGSLVTTLVNANQQTGKYNVNFEATNLPVGVYYVEFTAENEKTIQRMVLVK